MTPAAMVRCDRDCRLYQSAPGICGAAARGLRVDVARDYRPIEYIEQRCEWFAPKRSDTDKRTGEERWPWLMAAYRERFESPQQTARKVKDSAGALA